MCKKVFLLLVFFLSILTTCSILPHRAFAQSANTGIEVNPSIVQLDLASDAPQTTLTYTNHSTQPITLSFSTSDVTESEDSYTLNFLNQKDVRNFKYGLSSWITFSNSSLLLNPGEKGSITLYINKDALTPGGHYGSVLAEMQQSSPTGQVTIKGILATLVFVRTHTGKEYEKGSITTFAPEQDFFSFPQNFLLRFTNSGDTYLIPYGLVSVYDMWGNMVAKGIVNTGSLFVLPESLRRLEIPVQLFGNIAWPGIYHASLSLHFGKTNSDATGANQQQKADSTFFSFGTLPFAQLLFVVILIALLYLAIRKRKK